MFEESRHLHVKGAAGFVATELLKIDDLGLALGRVASTGHEIELKDNGNFTVLMPHTGHLDVLVGGREYRVISGRPLVFRPGERRTRAESVLAARFRATTLQISADRVRALALANDLSADRLFGDDVNDLSGAIGQYLAPHLPQLADDVFARPESAVPRRVLGALDVLITEQLSEFMSLKWESTSHRGVLPAFHRVRQAEELMRAHSDEPLSMLDLARSLGVSLRSLQLAFNETYGLGPRDVLNRIRLEKARQRLLAANGDGQVTVVALESGFFHLSRFAQTYARAFGERPSETLARRRA